MERLMENPELVTIFGGSGFVGTQVTQALARAGYRVRVAVRRPDLAGHVRPLGAVGQVVPVQANLRNRDSVAAAVRGASIVINLAAIGIEKGKQRFRAINVNGARHVAEAAKAAGARTLIHMSVLGADETSPSLFARSRAMGEAAVKAAFPAAIIFRPSIVFGPGDGFFNQMGMLARLLPVMPLFGGKTQFQPVYVGDVAEALAAAAQGNAKPGKIYELGGPEVLTHRQLIERVLQFSNRSNPILPLPNFVGSLIALPMQILPKPLITGDQLKLLGIDNVVSAEASKDKRNLAGLGIAPRPLDAVLPGYLWRFSRNGQFDRQTA
ncbi:MAG: complex I NDUFA9 subunit family protein [Hyphomicrobiales bacterium]|nr:MAG: complex I NDUFA9 subunit family protein [Hyphomicrobiales bacterium]